jgi:hypothetical protein
MKFDCDIYLNDCLYAAITVEQGTFDQIARHIEDMFELSVDELKENNLVFKLFRKDNGLTTELGTGYYRTRQWVSA